ncbi:uncharacterized protein LOC129596539 [Paramacrobiotus metropolitanus]|uniref:uncharacterized protein LOC129596539 n=1 Tax=Paramacrobiotus metropolitanus TaxID=2943436 RepID=UPI0024462B4C|nr:uncharacterized protein LOC129596539 [Paramacrobiotus metropolitanus]
MEKLVVLLFIVACISYVQTDTQVTIDRAKQIVALAQQMQADINSKGKSYQHMADIVAQVSIIVNNTDTDGQATGTKASNRASNGLTLAGGIVSGIGGALSSFGKLFN